ncbi:hypothetical protein STAS_03914 [Striga asiatica]|uniref:Uncharacterized protein n=1 Tax=Striga asiatica TaxID=4170 RepID=A0A5A7P5S8_STRAF|nr:hypothetical protein STAS_03914 [Striga asiatica]
MTEINESKYNYYQFFIKLPLHLLALSLGGDRCQQEKKGGKRETDFPRVDNPFSDHRRSAMAYRRRQQVGRTDSSYSNNYDFAPPRDGNASASPASSLAARAVGASAAYRDSSLSSAYEHSTVFSPRDSSHSSGKDQPLYESPKKKNMNESRQGFWRDLAQKAKAILDDDNVSGSTKRDQHYDTYNSSESHQKTDSPSIKKKLGALKSSLNHIGGTIGNALEEGITAVENRTADIIQETRNIRLTKKGGSSIAQNQDSEHGSLRQTRRQPQFQTHTDLETQLKASRDVSMAMAAKVKLLLRELKTVRLQLETLLTEKSRLAHENSVYARENRFLREIVEYHQLTMQDLVYFDEGNEEITEVYPIKIDTQSVVGTLPSPTPIPTIPEGAIS